MFAPQLGHLISLTGGFGGSSGLFLGFSANANAVRDSSFGFGGTSGFLSRNPFGASIGLSNGGLSSGFVRSLGFLSKNPFGTSVGLSNGGLSSGFGGVFGSSFVPQTVQNFSPESISAPQFEHIILLFVFSDFSPFSRIISDGAISFSDGLSGLAKRDFPSDLGGFGRISGVGGTGGTDGIGSALSNFVPHIVQNLRLPSTDFPHFGQLMLFGCMGLPFIGGFIGGIGLPFTGGFIGGTVLPFIGGGSNLNPQILQNFIDGASTFPH